MKQVGFVARFKPLHNGAVVLEEICKQSEHLIIGIGSSNKYNLRNPFTAEESHGMVDAYLKPRASNYSVIYVPDFGHIPGYADGQKWREYVITHFGQLDAFITSNDYVAGLLQGDYPIVHPASLLPPERQFKLKATQVRYEMASGGDWRSLVPPEVAQYLESNGLVERFRREFGLATIAELAGKEYCQSEDKSMESSHAREG